jgi:hypothetical protein
MASSNADTASTPMHIPNSRSSYVLSEGLGSLVRTKLAAAAAESWNWLIQAD